MTVLVRGESLTNSMPDYLIREINAAPNGFPATAWVRLPVLAPRRALSSQHRPADSGRSW